MNPYLALAGIVAAGMDGIRNKLELPVQGPELNECGSLPASLEAAIEELDRSETMRDYLGEEFVNWYVNAKTKEIEVVNQIADEKYGGDRFKAELEFYSKWI